MRSSEENKYTISSVDHALKVLEYIIKRQSDVSAIEIHARTGIPKATLHKLLQTLRDLGYIEQNPTTNQYYPTFKMLQVGYYCIDRWQFYTTFYPYVLMFVRRFNCPISLTAYSDAEAVTMYSAVGGANVIVDGKNIIGKTASLYASSTGRLLLSSMPDDNVRELLRAVPLTPFTDRTASSVEEIVHSLAPIRERGYCRLDGEIYYGFSSFSFPLKDIDDKLIGSINLVIQGDRVDDILTADTIKEIKLMLEKVRLVCN